MGAVNGDNYCRINLLDIFSSSHSFNTTNAALDIEYNCPLVGVSPSFIRASWSIPGRCGCNVSANNWLNNGRNSWYCFGTISSKGHSFKCFGSIALLISYKDALYTIRFPFLTVWKKDAPFKITVFPPNGLGGRICGLNIFLLWLTGSGGSFRDSLNCYWCIMAICNAILGAKCNSIRRKAYCCIMWWSPCHP